MTFKDRCRLSEQCLPKAPYRDMLTKLHKEMLEALNNPNKGVNMTLNDCKWSDEEQSLYESVRRRGVMIYINTVNSVIRRTPLDWTESEAQHALKAILTCITATYHLKVTEGEVCNAWVDIMDEAIATLADDEGLQQT